MASAHTFMAFCLVLSTLRLTLSETYTVGDSSQWTVGPNYTAWGSSKTFYVGDTIVFQYNNQFHNVLQVIKSNYHSCNATSPLSTYTTGKDSITMKKRGHRFYICGYPGHCDGGQKVDIRVLRVRSTGAPSPLPELSPSPSSPSSTVSPPPPPLPSGNSKNSAPPITKLRLQMLISVSMIIAIAAIVDF